MLINLRCYFSWSRSSSPFLSSKEVEPKLEDDKDRYSPRVHKVPTSGVLAALPLLLFLSFLHAPVPSPVVLEQNPHQPLIPYPSRLNKEKLQDKSDIQIHVFLQMFKKIYFNISFAEALAHMPKFAKMVKDLLSNKEKLLELAITPLNENCSTVLQNYRLKYPRKHGDESIHKIDILDMTCEDDFHEVINVQKLINPISGSPTPSSGLVVESLTPFTTPLGILTSFRGV
ncbi:hypothetical protein Tco_0960484 [Tanacetum coccineum]